MADGRICFANKGDWLVLKFTGEIRFTMGGKDRPTAALDAFLDRRFESQDYTHVLIDLTEAESIDSTNLGLLAKVAVNARRRAASKPIVIVPEGDLRRLLDSVGFERIFNIVDAGAVPGSELQSLPDTVGDGMGGDRELILEAHRTLADICPENYESFKDVIRLMQHDIDRDSPA